MRLLVRTLLALLLLVFPAVPAAAQDDAGDQVPPTPPADGEIASVIDVTDGDTIKVELADGTIERLRYIGIDTPETARSDDPVEPWGAEASAANESLVAGQQVLLERDVSERDRYERLLRYVWVDTPDGPVMVNDELVRRGLAEVKAYRPDTRHHEYLLQTQAEAARAGVGMHGSGADYDGSMEPAALSLMYIEAYNQRDVNALRRMFSPTIEDVDAILAQYEQDWAANDSYLRPTRFVRQEDTVMAELTLGPARRSQGPSVGGVIVHRWVEGLLVEYRLYLDPVPSER